METISFSRRVEDPKAMQVTSRQRHQVSTKEGKIKSGLG